MATRNRDLRPDPQGRYRPYLGWKRGEDGVRRQHRFNLGTDKREAERRFAKIRELYDENLRIDGPESNGLWWTRALYFAERIAKGEFRIEFPPLGPDDGYADTLLEYAQMIHTVRGWFLSLEFVPSDPALYHESTSLNQKLTGEKVRGLEVELKELGVLPADRSLPERLIPGTLHEAFSDYEAEVRNHSVKPGSSDLTPYGKLRLARLKRFRKAHDDIPLYDLNFDACSAMVAHWRNRPVGERGASSRDNARHHLGELMRFFRWLDTTEKYRWQSPRGLERIDRRVGKKDSERKLSSITKATYSVEELAVLNKHATPIERLLLYVGLNCAMGAAELGRLVAEDIRFDTEHEHAGRLHFASTNADSFLRFLRPKTGVFGEWLLWPETAHMLRWGLARSRKIGSDLLFVSEKGAPWYNEKATNAQSKFANTWNRLLDRVQKSQSDFRRLPFGTLRDTLPDLLRHRERDDLASLCLAHGSSFHGDNFLECYGNKPFGLLHTALRELQVHFLPFFTAAPDDPCGETKSYLSLSIKEKIRTRLREGGVPALIARECGVSPITVHRERAILSGAATGDHDNRVSPPGTTDRE